VNKPRVNKLRAVDVARLSIGLLALTRPEDLLRLSSGDDSGGVRSVVRVLGARYVIQAAGGSALHRWWVPALDAGVDVVHALSMTGVALWAPKHRRLAVFSATAALCFAAADLNDPVPRRVEAGRVRESGHE
jgi:hypothetical protein